MFEIERGMHVLWTDDDGNEVEGIVNGAPYVVWGSSEPVVRIPVHVPESNANFDVAGRNVLDVDPHPAGGPPGG